MWMYNDSTWSEYLGKTIHPDCFIQEIKINLLVLLIKKQRFINPLQCNIV